MRKDKWSRIVVGIYVGIILCCAKLTAQTNTFPSSGNVGIGTTSPVGNLQITGSQVSLNDSATTLRLEYQGGAASGSYGPGITFAQQWISSSPLSLVRTGAISGVKTWFDNGFGGGLAFFYQPNASGANLVEAFRLTGAGNVGIGTTNPGATLEVNGNVKLTAGSGSSLTFPDGTVQSTAYVGTSCSTGGEQLGPATAPSGACPTNGAWAFSQDGHATFCASGTWTTKI